MKLYSETYLSHALFPFSVYPFTLSAFYHARVDRPFKG